MGPLRTLEDLIHAVTNSLCLISSHAQYQLGKSTPASVGNDEFRVIYEEAERAARLLSLVPRNLASVPIHIDPSDDVEPAAHPDDSQRSNP